jgi:pimeloyl-ACP methyl ester carboxylesterase
MPDRVKTFIAYGGHPYPASADDRAAVEEINAILQRGMQGWVDRMDAAGVLAQYPNPDARRARLLAADPAALIAANIGSGTDPGSVAALSRLTMPCLLIAGQRDGANDLARQAARDLPNADFVSVGNIGHSMVHAQTILPYVRAFLERNGVWPHSADQ